MENLQNWFGESVAPVAVGVLGTVLIALLFGVTRALVGKLRPIVTKTKTTLDDAALDAVEEGVEIAQKDAIRRLDLTRKK